MVDVAVAQAVRLSIEQQDDVALANALELVESKNGDEIKALALGLAAANGTLQAQIDTLTKVVGQLSGENAVYDDNAIPATPTYIIPKGNGNVMLTLANNATGTTYVKYSQQADNISNVSSTVAAGKLTSAKWNFNSVVQDKSVNLSISGFTITLQLSVVSPIIYQLEVVIPSTSNISCSTPTAGNAVCSITGNTFSKGFNGVKAITGSSNSQIKSYMVEMRDINHSVTKNSAGFYTYTIALDVTAIQPNLIDVTIFAAILGMFQNNLIVFGTIYMNPNFLKATAISRALGLTFTEILNPLMDAGSAIIGGLSKLGAFGGNSTQGQSQSTPFDVIIRIIGNIANASQNNTQISSISGNDGGILGTIMGGINSFLPYLPDILELLPILLAII
jgi:hypothetical protein